jgi:aminopeptidase N
MSSSTTTSPARDLLTQVEAEARAARISNTAYTLHLDLVKGSPAYRGEVTVAFEDSGSGDTFLCYRGKAIERLEVNGEAVAEPDWNGYRLTLPGALLRAQNTVRIVYENEYDHSGDGFHQFIDPEDGQEYLYTNFEPYEAHRLFPGFDQPDIKGTYTLTVTAPADWELIHNSLAVATEDAGDGRSTRRFETTKPFSTYLFALIAGPYEAFREEHNGIPLGLFCRKSLARYIDTDELFTISKQGLDFFATFFDYPYPFGKYDQVFVPEFNAGAMENVGAVTHNEYMVFRDPPTDTQRRRRAETVLHEMAHMWFGDLVTMKWWNDLWLNESFATYMSYLCITEATRFKTAWQDFNAVIKNWAYRQDQLITTHPIAGQVADTEQTFLNFDGITYGKGASVLKQLVAAIGMDGFREGMRHYFRTYAYGNATLAQFLASLEAGSGKDLKEWSRLWLETSSLNTIAAHWEADGDRISRLVLTQTAPADYPTLRPHTLEVGLVREDDGRVTIAAVPATIATAEAEVPGATGLPRPSLVFPNHNDHAYAKVALDPDSVRFAREKLERIDDALLRQLMWSSLWNMVRDQQLKSTEYLAVVRERVKHEPSIAIVEPVLNQALTALSRYVPEALRDDEAHRLFLACWEGLQAAPPGDPQITWMRALIGSAANRDDIALLGKLADGEESVPGLQVDQQMRWDIAIKFMAYGLDGAAERLAAEAVRDPSDRGQRAKLRGETSAPDPEVKRAAWEKFHGEGYGSLYLTAAAMNGFNWYRQRELLEPYVEEFFRRVPEVFRTRDKEFYSDYFGALFPSYRVERGILERSQALLAEVGDELPALARMLREANDDLERSIKCREFAQK